MADSNELIEHLFRREYGKLVSILTGIFGSENVSLAEDVMQETLISALHHWAVSGIPQNPQGWLIQVAKRKALNEIKRNNRLHKYVKDKGDEIGKVIILDSTFLENEIEDSQLRMVFLCCHPELSIESQIAITLKILCGFGSKEIARALLISESAILKKIYRAKQTIRRSSIPFEVPSGTHARKRIDTVLIALYLLFNEGYSSSVSQISISKELCLEAIRLTRILADHFHDHKATHALLALMCLHTARFNARVDDHSGNKLFQMQNRALWDKQMINIGMGYLKESMNTVELSTYHVEAGIAAEYCLASSLNETNWQSIYNHYELLQKLKPNPLIKLNLAIVQNKILGTRKAIQELRELTEDPLLLNQSVFWATFAVFLLEINEPGKSIEYLNKAKSLNPPPHFMSVIDNYIKTCEAHLI